MFSINFESDLVLLHSRATASCHFNDVKVQMTKVYISVFFITALTALFQGTYRRKPRAKIPISPEI